MRGGGGETLMGSGGRSLPSLAGSGRSCKPPEELRGGQCVLACSCSFQPRLTRAPPRGPLPSGSSFPEGSEFSGDWPMGGTLPNSEDAVILGSSRQEPRTFATPLRALAPETNPLVPTGESVSMHPRMSPLCLGPGPHSALLSLQLFSH